MTTTPPPQSPPIDTASEDITHADVVTLTAWMGAHGSTATDVAHAVEKPWKHRDWIALAKAGRSCPMR